jgi:DNA-binding MarR family transcriptional regulator
MPHAESTVEQLMELLQRFMRLQPNLAFPDENVARLQRQMRELRRGASGNPGDRIFLFRILDNLRRKETPPTMGALSAELGIPLSTATRMADGLVRAKFAKRRTDANDRRVVRLCMTETGRQFIQTAMNHAKQHIAQLLNHFSTEEQAQLLRLMNKLIDSMQADREPEPAKGQSR